MGFDVVWVVSVLVIVFVCVFFVGYLNFFSVDDDDVVVVIYMWSERCFVFVVQVYSND